MTAALASGAAVLLGAPGYNAGRVFIVLGVLAGLSLVVIIAGALIHKKLSKDPAVPLGGYTLDQLQRMRDQGQLTQEEYDMARGMIIAGESRAGGVVKDAVEDSGHS